MPRLLVATGGLQPTPMPLPPLVPSLRRPLLTWLALGCAGLPAGVAAAEESVGYRINRGDTLIGVRNELLRPGADWRLLQRLNRIADPRRLKPDSTLQIPLSLLRAQDTLVEVLYTHGEVLVVRRGGAASTPLSGGETLARGDRVNTGQQSSALLRMADGARVLLRPLSLLVIEQALRLGRSDRFETGLQLEQGSADSTVPASAAPAPRSRLELRTPMVNLAVRGTEFRALADALSTRVEVLEGQVAAGSTLVAGGFGTVATAGRVAPARALLPAPVLSGLPERIERLPLQLQWPVQAGASAYRAQVFEAEAPGRLRLEGAFTDAAASWSDDLPDGRYEFRLRSADANGLEGRDGRALFTLKARPEPPFMTAPLAGAQSSDEQVTFSWTRAAAAQRYRFQLADGPAFDPVRVERSDLSATELSLALPVGTHHWRVASVRGENDLGPWSDVRSVTRLTVPPPPPPPTAEPPQPAAQGVRLGWARSPVVGVSYQIQVARDAAFTDIVADERTSEPHWLLKEPEPGTYHVRVRTIEAQGRVGPYGSTQQVDVPRRIPWWWLLPAALLLLL